MQDKNIQKCNTYIMVQVSPLKSHFLKAFFNFSWRFLNPYYFFFNLHSNSTNLPTLKSFTDIPLHFIEKKNKIVHCTALCTVYLPSNNNEGHFSVCKTFVIRDKVATVSKKYIFLSKPASKELTWQRQLLHRERKSRLLMHFEPRSN